MESKDMGTKRKLDRVKLIRLIFIITIIVIIITIYSFYFSTYDLIRELTVPFITVILTAGGFTISSLFRKDENKKEVEEYYNKLKSSLIENGNSDTEKNLSSKEENDALKLMLVNMEEIKAYYTLSKSQAKDSFKLSVWMCVLGFLLIVTAIILPFIANGKFESSIISAASGAIVEIVAGTSLLVYKNTLSQLNLYYKSLHENERFLSTVNLVRKMDKEKQDDMYAEIIRSELKK